LLLEQEQVLLLGGAELLLRCVEGVHLRLLQRLGLRLALHLLQQLLLPQSVMVGVVVVVRGRGLLLLLLRLRRARWSRPKRRARSRAGNRQARRRRARSHGGVRPHSGLAGRRRHG